MEQATRAAAAASTGTVLIVDDDHNVREMLHGLMGIMGFAADLAGNGEEALTLLTDKDYDAIVCDLSMPRMCGDELFRRCRDQRPEAARRFVFLSAAPAGSSQSSFAGATGQPYLPKPCGIAAIQAAINQVVVSGP
jgi:CheY-like chemotaxis protein